MKGEQPSETLEERRFSGPPGTWNGAFILNRGSANLHVICSDGMGWDHVSVSLKTRCPTWEEMCYVKSQFFADEECVMQLHPPKSEWINNHRFCLHLWRPQAAAEMEAKRIEWGVEWNEAWRPYGEIPLPPGICVGVKELGVIG